ncbi:DUF1285 domain-containing protein [Thalassotalea sp. 1_MG-2023]|uniref:DUF1285 domain-containing protein n=1 Tax=Thalassotalea sp. 1_MG-2023 TaxID=3062680 RepID=UPI0026E48453|nr:DUF1285 domain-containing protein [Thalassotalea sp. 1_MG-2023]MDO6426074.1 DUF1285 domain-containing protein [Thalassotalea sp. 1_MG-2023]
MSLEKLVEQLKQQEKGYPPVESWDPVYCGEMDLIIKANGDWYYGGTIFKRMSLVKLLASVLKKETNEYFLVTPVEKIKIQVEKHPLIITQWRWLDEQRTTMQLTTNVDDEFILDAEHPVSLEADGGLSVIVRRNLTAVIHRNVYYQWVELAKETEVNGKTAMTFNSTDQCINLGFITE